MHRSEGCVFGSTEQFASRAVPAFNICGDAKAMAMTLCYLLRIPRRHPNPIHATTAEATMNVMSIVVWPANGNPVTMSATQAAAIPKAIARDAKITF